MKQEHSFDLLPEGIRKKLQDLSASLKEITVDKEGWCYKYRAKKEIGKYIAEDFVRFNREKTRKENSFSFSDEVEEAGILSQLQGFQALAMLWEEFDVEVDEKKLVALIDDFMARVKVADGQYRFDATPYLIDSRQFDGGYAYIDTLTWFMSAACSVFRLIIKKNVDVGAERLDQLVDGFVYGMRFLTEESFINIEDRSEFSYGWNYTCGCLKPSLYFTFAVSEVLIDVYTTFEATVMEAETEYVQSRIDELLGGLGEEYREEIRAKKDQVEQVYLDYLENNSKTDEEREREKDLFFRINGSEEVFGDASLYRKLEEQCKKAANDIWALTKEKLAESFFSFDLKNTIPEDVIEQSITSDALFNSVFILNILINAGLDEDAEDRINYFTVNESAEYKVALEEYDEMRDIIRLGYDKVYQTYSKLRKKQKDYIVNEYVLTLAEDFAPAFSARVKEMRKARIRVFSLMPLLVKTKTTMSEFVIRYPQFDMQLYLEQILDCRYTSEDGKQAWIWERDGYSASSNYYFINALSSFYDYYQEYELEYAKNANKNEEAKRRIREEHRKELEAKGGEIYNCRHELQAKELELEEQDRTIEDLKRQIGEFKSDPLRETLTNFVYKAIQERIEELITAFFRGMAEDITDNAKKRAADKKKGIVPSADGEESKGFEDSLTALLLSVMSEQMVRVLLDDDVKSEDIDKRLLQTAKRTRSDLRNVFYYYIRQVNLSGDGEGAGSDFSKTEGYKGLPGFMREMKTIQKNDKK